MPSSGKTILAAAGLTGVGLGAIGLYMQRQLRPQEKEQEAGIIDKPRNFGYDLDEDLNLVSYREELAFDSNENTFASMDHHLILLFMLLDPIDAGSALQVPAIRKRMLELDPELPVAAETDKLLQHVISEHNIRHDGYPVEADYDGDIEKYFPRLRKLPKETCAIFQQFRNVDGIDQLLELERPMMLIEHMPLPGQPRGLGDRMVPLLRALGIEVPGYRAVDVLPLISTLPKAT